MPGEKRVLRANRGPEQDLVAASGESPAVVSPPVSRDDTMPVSPARFA